MLVLVLVGRVKPAGRLLDWADEKWALNGRPASPAAIVESCPFLSNMPRREQGLAPSPEGERASIAQRNRDENESLAERTFHQPTPGHRWVSPAFDRRASPLSPVAPETHASSGNHPETGVADLAAIPESVYLAAHVG